MTTQSFKAWSLSTLLRFAVVLSIVYCGWATVGALVGVSGTFAEFVFFLIFFGTFGYVLLIPVVLLVLAAIQTATRRWRDVGPRVIALVLCPIVGGAFWLIFNFAAGAEFAGVAVALLFPVAVAAR